MFKQILIVIINLLVVVFIISLSYISIKKLLLLTYKLNVSKNIIKNNLMSMDKKFFDIFSDEIEIKKLSEDGISKVLFYTETPWNTQNNHNYIWDTLKDRYYIIDSNYYYYLCDENTDRFKLFLFSDNVKIKLFDFNKYSNKINYI